MPIDQKQIARTAAQILLDTKSVLFNAREHFIFTSGRASPVYTDCRRLISFPQVRRTLIEMDVSRAKRETRIDSAAAAFLLQGALDRLRSLRAEGPAGR